SSSRAFSPTDTRPPAARPSVALALGRNAHALARRFAGVAVGLAVAAANREVDVGADLRDRTAGAGRVRRAAARLDGKITELALGTDEPGDAPAGLGAALSGP